VEDQAAQYRSKHHKQGLFFRIGQSIKRKYKTWAFLSAVIILVAAAVIVAFHFINMEPPPVMQTDPSATAQVASETTSLVCRECRCRDIVLTLSTCSYEFDKARLVVQAVPVKDEDEP